MGLKFLHSCGIIHGNLNSSHILINDMRRACLTNFALAYVPGNMNYPETSSSARSIFGAIQWMAPELFDLEDIGPPNIFPTTASDIYALAMVTIEIFTGDVPFPEYNAYALPLKVAAGHRPERPSGAVDLGLSDGLWDLVQACWKSNKNERPDISYVIDRLRDLIPGLSLLERLTDFDASSESSMRILQHALDSPADVRFAMRLRGQDAQRIIDILDQAMHSTQAHPGIVEKFHRTLIKTCGQTGLLPSSYMLSEGLTKIGNLPIASGGFADVWKGLYKDHGVAIKSLRVYDMSKFDDIRKANDFFMIYH
jgi:serine/threonine protein kinase